MFLLYDNYTIYYLEIGRVEKAIKYIEKALSLKDKIRISYVNWLFLTEAHCHVRFGRYSKAFEYLNEGLVIVEETNITDHL